MPFPSPKEIVLSSVPVSRDEFFHFLENEDEFVYSYFGCRPDNYSEAVSYEDPDKNYSYEYLTTLSRDGNIDSKMNRYVCDGELYYAIGVNSNNETYRDGLYSSSRSFILH